MEHMELGEKRETITRLAICVVIALVLYWGGKKLCAGKEFPLLEKYGPWLEENKIQAIAIAAAVLFGISLAVFPLKKGEAQPPEFCPPEAGESSRE